MSNDNTHASQTFVWMQGNLSDGFHAFGPYASVDEAFAAHDGEEGWVMTLNNIKEMTA